VCIVWSIYGYKYKHKFEYEYEYEHKYAYRYVYMNIESSLNRAQAGVIFCLKNKICGYICIVFLTAFSRYLYKYIFSSRYFLLSNSSRGNDFIFGAIVYWDIHLNVYLYYKYVYDIYIHMYITYKYIHTYVNVYAQMIFFLDLLCTHVYIYMIMHTCIHIYMRARRQYACSKHV